MHQPHQHPNHTEIPQTTMYWLEGRPPATTGGVTWGVAWPQGTVPAGCPFGLRGPDGTDLAVQSWTTASWPDGTIKWSAHAAAISTDADQHYQLLPGQAPASGAHQIRVSTGPDRTRVDTGLLRVTIPHTGGLLVRSLETRGRTVASDGRLISELSHDPEGRQRTRYQGQVELVTVEQDGPVRAVVLITGRHVALPADSPTGPEERPQWLPFRIRLYCYAGSDQIRMVHSFIWDGDPQRDFLCGLGIRFDVPMRAEQHNRHIRLAGSTGFLSEAVRPVTGLWPDPGEAVRIAQFSGQPTPPTEQWVPVRPNSVSPANWDQLLEHIPLWNDWTLSQLSADGYTVRKRTRAGHGWVGAPGGTRSRGYAYVGTPDGGLEMGLRGFWQSHPTQLDIRNAASPLASITAWLWSPEAGPMDLRFYHPGEAEQTLPGQLTTVRVTYEDYVPGYGDASGVARTHELLLRAANRTPSQRELDERATACSAPLLLRCLPERLHQARVFGQWALPDRSNPTAATIEDRLRLITDYYLTQIDQRRWYGFWDYGDVMHSYDHTRHTWSYDIGGYAWDNSELSTDLWLWLSYLRTGDAQVFRMAEAMTRHTGEVDVYHAGRFAGFGTRHNVQHWGCACKQLRVSSAVYRRYLYFLTADERIGDLLDEVVITDQTLATLDRNRAVGARQGRTGPDRRGWEVDLGIDYGAMLASWLTQWERTGDPLPRQRIMQTLTDIGRMPHGYQTGIAHLNPSTGSFTASDDQGYISHLSAVFGIVEVLTEILELVELPEFRRAWLRYCRLYLAPPEQQLAETGLEWQGSLRLAHSRLLAWAAQQLGDRALAERAWTVFLHDTADRRNLNQLIPNQPAVLVSGPLVAEPVTELPGGITTNDAAQYGLAAIQNLALIGDQLPIQSNPELER